MNSVQLQVNYAVQSTGGNDTGSAVQAVGSSGLEGLQDDCPNQIQQVLSLQDRQDGPSCKSNLILPARALFILPPEGIVVLCILQLCLQLLHNYHSPACSNKRSFK